MDSHKNTNSPKINGPDYAQKLGMDYVKLDGFIIEPSLFEVLPASHAAKLHAIPYKMEDNTLYVATYTPQDIELKKKLTTLTGCQISLMVGNEEAIKATLKRSESSSKILEHVSRAYESANDIGEDTLPLDQVVNMEDIDERDTATIIPLINSIILAALQRRASDIHIESSASGVAIKYRIDGVLYHATEQLSRQFHTPLITRLKVMSELDIAEKRIPQDGRFKLSVQQRNVDFRISVLPSTYGEDVVIRILDQASIAEEFKQLNIDYLGLSPEISKHLRKSIHEPYGLVLITGPTGSGKTTTLYSALTELNTGEEKIITIEDPVEYQLAGITQIPVNEKKQLTFAKGLRSILRHDPDKIMVGEIRDSETAKIAIQSALTGHLVFTTLHANNCFDVIGRLKNMEIDVYSVVSALNCVMAQRLVRKICPHCKEKIKIDQEYLEFSGLYDDAYTRHTWYDGKGCDKCYHTGYLGRSAVAEFLNLTPALRDMLLNHSSLSAIQEKAVQDGMTPFRQAAIAKAMAGETSLKEINRVIFME